MDKEDVRQIYIYVYIYIYMYIYIYITYICACTHTIEYYSAIKKNEISPLVTIWIDLKDIMLSETSQRNTI